MPKKCFVYIIQSGKQKNAPIKIGVANDPLLRIKELQTGNPSELKLVSSIELGSRAEASNLESWLHKRFSRARVHGEWFRSDRVNLKKALSEWNDIDTTRNVKSNNKSCDFIYGSSVYEEVKRLRVVNKALLAEIDRLNNDISEYLDGEIINRV